MKKIIVILSLLSIMACKKEEEKNSEPSMIDTAEGVQNINKAADAIKNYEKKIEELKKVEPVSNEIYKEILGENLGNLKRNSFNTGNASVMGLSSGEATYSNESNKSVKISIFDGAGETGSAVIAMTHLALSMGVESIQETTTKKNEEINGYMCMTENDTNPDFLKSSITFVYKDRYQVNLEGSQVQLDELKDYVKKIDLSKLD